MDVKLCERLENLHSLSMNPRGAKGTRSLGLLGIAAVALLQLGLGLSGLVASASGFERPRLSPSEIPDSFRLIAVLSLGSLASYLLIGARRDARVERLATLFLLMAVFYASPAIESLALALPAPAALAVRLCGAVRIDAFMPAVAWLFFRDFPRALEWPRTARAVSWIVRSCILVALVLVAANLALALGADLEPLSHFDRADPASSYWTVVFGLALPAPAFIIWRVRHAPEDERRRVRWFTTGLAIGALPSMLFALLPTFSEPIEDWARGGGAGIRAAQALMLSSLVWIAANTAYSVVVKRVLEVGVVLRKAAQHGLARTFTAVVAAAPFTGAGILVYRMRGEPIAALLDGARPRVVGGLVATGAALHRKRRAAMGAIDRALFRESHDARQILISIAERSGATNSLVGLASSLTAEIDHALHLEAAALLVLDAKQQTFVAPAGGVRVLSGSSQLAGMLSASRRPLPVNLDRAPAALRALPEAERQWLADAAAEVLVPLIGSGARIVGVLALGAKRSELPFSREDLLLLTAIGSAAGARVENRLWAESLGSRGLESHDSAASECMHCGWLGEPSAAACPSCSGTLLSANVPHELAGKFRVERRLGAGAMGVVYRGTDITLRRSVALKTLPVTSPEDSIRLRREARAMAAITHPNLALIFGAETWRGTPVLVIEYLAGGTLAEHLAKGPLAPLAALRMCRALAGALERAHASGILHRDVKPSNIGFTEDAVPKLLDFGLVRIAGELPVLAPHTPAHAAVQTAGSGLIGTPLYMSPEAWMGAEPNPTFDLWSLSVVAFEAIAGRHPFERASLAETHAALCEGRRIDLPQFAGSAVVEEMFASALAADRSRRPATARKLARVFEEAELQISADA